MQEITNLFVYISYHCPYWYNKIFVFFAKVYTNIKYGKFVCPLFANMKPCIETVQFSIYIAGGLLNSYHSLLTILPATATVSVTRLVSLPSSVFNLYCLWAAQSVCRSYIRSMLLEGCLTVTIFSLNHSTCTAAVSVTRLVRLFSSVFYLYC